MPKPTLEQKVITTFVSALVMGRDPFKDSADVVAAYLRTAQYKVESNQGHFEINIRNFRYSGKYDLYSGKSVPGIFASVKVQPENSSGRIKIETEFNAKVLSKLELYLKPDSLRKPLHNRHYTFDKVKGDTIVGQLKYP